MESKRQPQDVQGSRGSTESHNEITNLLTNLGFGFGDVYQIEKKLQSGSYGSVFTCKHKMKAENNECPQLFAVKVIPRDKLKEEALYREVDVLKTVTNNQLNNDRLLLFIDFYVSSNEFHLVTEYCSGGDVYDRLAKRVFYTEEQARDLAYNLLDAIRSLHSIPIVHRDIKPENLLLKSQGSDTDIKIADFGFARKVTNGELLLTKCGTPSFVAPELLFSKGYDKRSDLWSVGVTIYILLAGYPPFQGKTSNDLFRKIRSANFKFHEKYWQGVSNDAKQLVVGLLTADPNRRLSCDHALESDWIKTDRKELSDHSLQPALAEIKKFHAMRTLRGAVHSLRWAMSANFWDSQKGSGFTRTSFVKSESGFQDMKTAKSFKETYRLEAEINKGTFATVWKGRDQRNDSIVAVKVVKREHLKQKDDAAVLNEVSILQSLRHPNILHIIEFFEESEFFYIPMELLEGGDVFDAIVKKNQYTEADARNLVKCLLEATNYLHNNMVAHRDLKPQNLLICSNTDTNIKIADFGFAKRVHAPKSLRTRLGTPTYVAPEILLECPYDERVDLWSIGVIIYVLLVGYPPFMEQNRAKLFQRIKEGSFEFFEEDWHVISQDVKDLISNLIVRDPSKRWNARQALQCSWFRTDEEQLRCRDISKSLVNVTDLNSCEKEDIWHISPKKNLDDNKNDN